ncbi:hypothetical protein SteCoe_16140 [Stentor coeruleus]|uniref:Uncharacterized protein n=1 Tax=Stentor coeruleus TaxID=5963 RepID=A0A1R2C1Y0_9CILI|nr:hypothetical protein SteCoe_16140 [Stentor coeruleus]
MNDRVCFLPMINQNASSKKHVANDPFKNIMSSGLLVPASIRSKKRLFSSGSRSEFNSPRNNLVENHIRRFGSSKALKNVQHEGFELKTQQHQQNVLSVAPIITLADALKINKIQNSPLAVDFTFGKPPEDSNLV